MNYANKYIFHGSWEKGKKEFKTEETCSAQNSPVRKHNPLVKVTSIIKNTLASVFMHELRNWKLFYVISP
jgi:hypothetical protein